MIYLCCQQLAKMMKNDKKSVPFEKIIPCNIGNPQSLEQMPLSFMRDVLSLFINPSLVRRNQNEVYFV